MRACLSSAGFLNSSSFSKESFKNTIRVSNSLGSDQARNVCKDYKQMAQAHNQPTRLDDFNESLTSKQNM